MKHILAHDLGTSGNKATLYTQEGAQKASATRKPSAHSEKGK